MIQHLETAVCVVPEENSRRTPPFSEIKKRHREVYLCDVGESAAAIAWRLGEYGRLGDRAWAARWGN